MVAKTKMQVVVTEKTQELLRDLAAESGLTQGGLIHMMLEMLTLRVGIAKESGDLDEDTKQSSIESFVALLLRDNGLLTDQEFVRTIAVADALDGDRCHERIQLLGDIAEERRQQLLPIWEVSRADAQERRERERWNAERAAAAIRSAAVESN